MKTSDIMIQTCIALVPGTIAMTAMMGPGVLINVAVAVLACLLLEAVSLIIRQQPVATLKDGSALLTGYILGLCLPPAIPILLLLVGCLFAIVLAKHFYGGLGQNLFNPAMIGFAIMIIAFPLAMSTWPESLGTLDLVAVKLGAPPVDGLSGATPLDQFRYSEGLTTTEFWLQPNVNHSPWLLVNLSFLAGGMYLLWRRIIRWLVPACMLGTLTVLSVLFFDNGSSQSLGSPYLHLFSGATMLAAFFVVTDPVTSPDSVRGQCLFGIGVGLLTFIIRTKGAYPEGVAFAVLIMNAVSPLIDHLSYRDVARDFST